MLRTDFHFDLPRELIAQQPAASRSASRLLSLDGATGGLRDLQFSDLPMLLQPADLLVFNDTRVIPARVSGAKQSGGRVEILLERALTPNTALVHLRGGKAMKPGAEVLLPGGERATLSGRQGELFELRFSCDVAAFFETHGEVPLPPYIGRGAVGADRERYQTVYARARGAVAAPTAGLHFDAELFAALAARGIAQAFVTLHVGAGTFQPMRALDIDAHEMHEEYLEVPESACAAVNAARAAGGRVIAVGTTVVRSLETAAAAALQAGGAHTAAVPGGAAHTAAVQRGAAHTAAPQVVPVRGMTRIFIRPGHQFRAVDAMITNFHLSESTLLMLCCAFAGRDNTLRAYAHAVRERYRFFSYGDAMFLTPCAAAHGRV